MAKQAGIEFSFSFGASTPRRKPDPGMPLRILVAGDFAGRGSRDLSRPLSSARPRKIDLDTFDDVMRAMGPEVVLRGGDGTSLRFERLEELHPDQLFLRLDWFARLRQLRAELQSPTTFARAAAALAAPPAPASPMQGAGGKESDQDAMARLLGKPAARSAAAPGAAPSGLDALLRDVVAPHVVAGPDPRLPELLTAVDAMAEGLMRAVLHDPAFQGFEAAWRGLDWLVRNLELDETLQVAVLDATEQELREEIADAGALKALVVGDGSQPPFSIVVWMGQLGTTGGDLALIEQLARLGHETGAVVLASAAIESWREQEPPGWGAVRGMPSAASFGLLVPRILLRLPYGKLTDPIEAFKFEEQSSPPAHDAYLWGSGALACAQMLGTSFRAAEGWQFDAADTMQVSGLPIHSYRKDGEPEQTPCAECWVSEALAGRWIERGLMPLVPEQGRDSVRLARMQSIAIPSRALAGRWES